MPYDIYILNEQLEAAFKFSMHELLSLLLPLPDLLILLCLFGEILRILQFFLENKAFTVKASLQSSCALSIQLYFIILNAIMIIYISICSTRQIMISYVRSFSYSTMKLKGLTLCINERHYNIAY